VPTSLPYSGAALIQLQCKAVLSIRLFALVTLLREKKYIPLFTTSLGMLVT
jgi:hypothetical protein